MELNTYVENSQKELYDLLVELCQIPAPSHKEDRRVEWIKDKLYSWGAKEVIVDEAKNVILPIKGRESGYTIFMAHTDVVFPDETPLPLVIKEETMHCPGIGDDTANVACLMMMAKYIIQNDIKPKNDLLIVANSCEEGLGNLKGVRQLMKDYEGQVREVISFDGTYGGVVNDAVGSHRYQIEARTIGGHSYHAFGNPNAVVQLSQLITTLYTMEVPKIGHTTYNVGGIEGGTSINTIPQYASMLYEYRSDRIESLSIMEDFFTTMIEAYKKMGMDLNVIELGKRPCKAIFEDETRLNELTDLALKVQADILDTEELSIHASSTDCNIPLSLGIPAICFGLIDGHGAHTREEFIYTHSLPIGLRLAAAFMEHFF